MKRLLAMAGLAGVFGMTGCSSTWETVSSRKFRERPLHTMFGAPEDPLHVLRTTPEGDERAAAMRRLKEPLTNGGTQADQDEVVEHILGPAAATDPSPVVRAAAIDALGRFQDPRVPRLLAAAYHQSSGRSATDLTQPVVPGRSAFEPVSAGRRPGGINDHLGLYGPTGFSPETVALLRSKSLEALARTGSPEAVDLLVRVAEGQSAKGQDPIDRDTRLAAVRGLVALRRPESVTALHKVLESEYGKDNGLVSRAHAGLVELTGRDTPPDPAAWGQLVQAGTPVVPPRTGIERAVGTLTSLVP